MATNPTPLPADLADAELWTDEYGTIWRGEPGAAGSVTVGDVVYMDEQGEDLGAYPIRWLPADQRRTVTSQETP